MSRQFLIFASIFCHWWDAIHSGKRTTETPSDPIFRPWQTRPSSLTFIYEYATLSYILYQAQRRNDMRARDVSITDVVFQGSSLCPPPVCLRMALIKLKSHIHRV